MEIVVEENHVSEGDFFEYQNIVDLVSALSHRDECILWEDYEHGTFFQDYHDDILELDYKSDTVLDSYLYTFYQQDCVNVFQCL